MIVHKERLEKQIQSNKAKKEKSESGLIRGSNEYIDEILKGSVGEGLKEDLNSFGKAGAKKINEAGNAIYKVITSNEVKGVAGGVTAGLIVSILSMLMHEKRQEALASRRASRTQRPRIPAPSRPAPPPPSSP